MRFRMGSGEIRLASRRSLRAQRITRNYSESSLERSLEVLESAPNYYNWIARLIQDKAQGHVLELGAGTGTFTKMLSRTADSVDAVEPSLRSFQVLQAEMESVDNVKSVHGSLDSLVNEKIAHYDHAVLVNVLEHIADDLKCFSDLAKVLRPGGGLAIWVPAHEFLYSDFDFKLGHFRRYNLSELRELAEFAGFRVEKIQYQNAPGAVAWWAVARLARREPTHQRLAELWDRLAVRNVAAVEERLRVPFGQSLLLLASLSE